MKQPPHINKNPESDHAILGPVHIAALDMETIELGAFGESDPRPQFRTVFHPQSAADTVSYKDLRVRTKTGYQLIRKFQNYGQPCDVTVIRYRNYDRRAPDFPQDDLPPARA